MTDKKRSKWLKSSNEKTERGDGRDTVSASESGSEDEAESGEEPQSDEKDADPPEYIPVGTGEEMDGMQS
jgi:hypothetical protein